MEFSPPVRPYVRRLGFEGKLSLFGFFSLAARSPRDFITLAGPAKHSG